jgi:hypothetical protein
MLHFIQSQGVSNHSIIADLLQDQSLFLGLSEEERDNRLKELGHVLFSGMYAICIIG